ncbi:MAG: hypothetical protein D6B25_19785 [Desulfobulbaceae bacterium]|nr:MAG: hypothetical protein D6B25_19785 [Desulfobulbaceae bacterium]
MKIQFSSSIHGSRHPGDINFESARLETYGVRDCRTRCDTDGHQIIRDDSGSINVSYYANKARTLRAQAICSFFRTIRTGLKKNVR